MKYPVCNFFEKKHSVFIGFVFQIPAVMAGCSSLCHKTLTDEAFQCPQCLYPLETPFTLKQCLHTFCKGCLDELPQTTKNDIAGWECPQCGMFSAVDRTEHNVFIQKLVDAQNVKTETVETCQITCKQCMDSESVAKWKCNDCKLELCPKCHSSHLNIPLLKGHTIVPLDSDSNADKAIDELVFCSKHPEKLIEAHCTDCSVPLCFLCKLTEHDTHKTETIEVALARLLPQLKKYNQAIRGKVGYFKKKIQTIRSQMEETKKSFANSRKQVQDHFDLVVAMLETLKCKHEDRLAEIEADALGNLEKVKLDLESEIEQAEQLMNMSALTTNNALNATLLTLLQADLMEKVKTCSDVKSQSLVLNLAMAKLSFSDVKVTDILETIFGEFSVVDSQCKINWDGWMRDDHHVCEDFATSFSQVSLSLVKDIKLPSPSYAILYTGNYVCVSLNGKILYYDLSGKLIKEVAVPFCTPLVMKELQNSKVVIGTSQGLYVIDIMTPENYHVVLQRGQYSGAQMYHGVLYVLNADKNEILSFRNKKGTTPKMMSFTPGGTVKLTCISKPNVRNTMCRMKTSFVVSSLCDRCIFVCDTKGNTLKKLMSDHHNFLCGIDTHRNIITTNYTQRAVDIFGFDQEKSLCQLRLKLQGKPFQMQLDAFGDLWILVENDKEYRLLKYRVW